MRVTVCIPTKNRPVELKRMRESLDKQTFKDFEVLVVDGNKVKGGLVVQENLGLLMAKGDIFIRTDDDAEVPENWLEEIVKTFDLPEVVGVTCPTIYPYPENRDLFLFQNKLTCGNWFWRMIGKVYYDYILEGKVDEVGKVMKSGAFTLGSRYYQSPEGNPFPVDVHDCCTMACRTGLLRKIGGFDETYSGVGDLNEPDVSFRLRKYGYILFTPKTYCVHYAAKSGVYSSRLNPWPRIRNFIIFHRRYFKFNLRFVAYLLFQGGYYAYKHCHSNGARTEGSASEASVSAG